MKKLLALTLVLVMLAGCSAPTVKLGLGMVGNVTNKAATAEDAGKTQADVTACAATFDANGKILAVSIDTIQAKASYDATGAATSEAANDIKSKKELKEEYNMKPASPIGKEWYEQIASFETYLVGKTADEAIKLPTYKKDENHTAVPDVEELKTTVTMTVGEYVRALEKAYANAK